MFLYLYGLQKHIGIKMIRNDRHYHEFEPKQLQMILNKANWKIIKDQKHISPANSIGIRPFLKNDYPKTLFCLL